ncbi:Hint domain-containing protein [Microvirga sp. 0TCS3.31]
MADSNFNLYKVTALNTSTLSFTVGDPLGAVTLVDTSDGKHDLNTTLGPATGQGDTFRVGTTVYTYEGGTDFPSSGDYFLASTGTAPNKVYYVFADTARTQGETLTVTKNQAITICFLPGTQIAAPSGAVAVESLKRGDLVKTADGRVAAVRWIGRQTISTLFADPLRVNPICIKAGALAENVPSRDLYVSPDHAILVDDILVHASALVNGTSIVRAPAPAQTFTYYHVELADHSLLLADNVPAESFIDNVDRLAFDNWAEHEALGDEAAPLVEMAYPRAKAARQVPVAIRERLADRAQALFGSLATQAA